MNRIVLLLVLVLETGDGVEDENQDEYAVHGEPSFGFFPHELGP